MTIFGNFRLGSSVRGVAVGEGFTTAGLFGVGLGFVRSIVGLIAIGGVALGVGGGVGGVTGRASPSLGTAGLGAGVGVPRTAVAVGGAARPLLLSVAIGVALGRGVVGKLGRLSLSMRGALDWEFASDKRKNADAMSTIFENAIEAVFKFELIRATVLSRKR